jgi:hypothetical protein
MSHDEELEEVSEQSRRPLLKFLFTLSRCKIAENDGSGDLLSHSQMHIDEWDEVTLAAQQRRR